MANKKTDVLFDSLSAAGGGIGVSLARRGMDQLNWFQGDDYTQNMVLGIIGSSLAAFGAAETKPMAFGMIGAASANMTSMMAMNALSRIVPSYDLDAEEEMDDEEDYNNNYGMNALSRIVPMNAYHNPYGGYGEAATLVEDSEFEY